MDKSFQRRMACHIVELAGGGEPGVEADRAERAAVAVHDLDRRVGAMDQAEQPAPK